MVKNEDIIGKIAIVLFIIFAVILITQIILKIVGKSPNDIQILYVGLGAIISYLLIMSYNLGQFVGEVKGFMKVSKNTFKKLGEEIIKKRK